MDAENNKEIDLIQLFESIKNSLSSFFKKIWFFTGKIVLSLIAYFLRYFVYYLVILVTGTVASIFLSFKTYEPIFGSELRLKSNVIPNEEIIPIINNLYLLTKENNYNEVAKNLQIKLSDAKKIKSIQAVWIIDKDGDNTPDYVDYDNEFQKKDTTGVRLNSEFCVYCEYVDTIVLNNVEKGLLLYLNNNTFIQERANIKTRQLEELKAKTEAELNDLDSFQIRYSNYLITKGTGEAKSNQFIVMNEKEIKLLHPQIFELLDKKQQYQKELELSTKSAVTIKTSFVKSIIPINNSKIGFSIKITILIFIAGFLFHLLIIKRKKLLEKINMHRNNIA